MEGGGGREGAGETQVFVELDHYEAINLIKI